MDTYPVDDPKRHNRSYAFEIDNAYIGVRAVARLLANVEGVRDIRVRKLFSSSPDIHVEFTFRGEPYIVWEPYGDSSVYWIGPHAPDSATAGIKDLQEAFQAYVPPFYRRLMGHMLSLKFLSWLLQRRGSSPSNE